jgi:Bacterial PH domain/Short C-terminal domain
MPTLSEVQQQIRALGNVDTFGTKKEIKYLPDILGNDESVLSLTSGLMDGSTWLVVCTEKRVIFLDKGLIYGLKQRETPLGKINSIEQKTGMIFGSIGIWDGAAHMQISNVMKSSVRPFVEIVNRARDALKASGGSNQGSGVSAGTDVASQLERLADLRDRGVLTDDEFQAQKAKILGV